jgi:hypothetical protein
MTPPPTSIDGTDITGATIDGQEVQEITVDGDTVFKAGTLPVAYSDLVAWYPFDSSFYGGSNADDATAVFNPAQSGDSTAFDGTVNGATYQSSGGVTDINAGANSGAFQFTSDSINMGDVLDFGTSSFTIMAWFEPDGTQDNNHTLIGKGEFSTGYGMSAETDRFFARIDDGTNPSQVQDFSFDGTIQTFTHGAFVVDRGIEQVELFKNGSSVGTEDSSATGNLNNSVDFIMGRNINNGDFNGTIDDARVYNTALSSSQINQIIQNTDPN